MPRYCVEYETFDGGDWQTETHVIDADRVTVDFGIVRFQNTTTDEEFLVGAEKMVAAWTNGD